jgi:hypothetical protein
MKIEDAKDQIRKTNILTDHALSECGHIGFRPYVQRVATTMHKESSHETNDGELHKKV